MVFLCSGAFYRSRNGFLTFFWESISSLPIKKTPSKTEFSFFFLFETSPLSIRKCPQSLLGGVAACICNKSRTSVLLKFQITLTAKRTGLSFQKLFFSIIMVGPSVRNGQLFKVCQNCPINFKLCQMYPITIRYDLGKVATL